MPQTPSGDTHLYAINGNRSGFAVRLVRGGHRIEKSFAEGKHGGRDAALAYAVRWRDEMVRLHTPASRRELAAKPRANGGPTPGVTSECDRHGQVKLWRAKTYVSPGVILQKTFSLKKWGRAARAMATAERRRQLEHLTGLRWVHPDEQRLRRAAPRRAALPPLPPPVPDGQRLRRNNQSGYPGVVPRRGSDGRRRYWTVQTTVGGRWVSRSFSIATYGSAVALILAVWERNVQCGLQRR